MEKKTCKYLFIILAALLLIYMLWLSRDAGMNCDEVLHYNHSLAVWKYYETGGKDTAALHTPVTHLQYYGQSYDNITTLLIKLTGAEDIYGFRHIMSTIAGWLTAIVAALFAVWLSGYRAGIITILLFAVSPTFLGHAQNNLKDIPFALSYISSLFFMFRLFSAEGKPRLTDLVFLTLSIAFCLSIRPGGMIVLAYLVIAFAVYFILRYFKDRSVKKGDLLLRTAIVTGITLTAWTLSVIFWPYALQDPVKNPFVAYRMMVHFPDTFRQIFQGTVEWSDFMPWYYLPWSMAITIPLVVTAGFLISPLAIFSKLKHDKLTWYLFLAATVLFPVIFVIIKKSNLYSNWRHFLFVYPGIVILAASAYSELYERFKKPAKAVLLTVLLLVVSVHPFLFVFGNKPYAYLYYNQLTGGLKGAFGNYETDYYFVNHRESAGWLLNYLAGEKRDSTVTVGSNFSAEWYFRKSPGIRNIYFRNEERSMNDWDYVVTTNRYISPYKLKNGLWPPRDAIKIVLADGVPVAAIEKRKTRDDYLGFRALQDGKNEIAVDLLTNALKKDSCDEMIFYNFAVALRRTGDYRGADSALQKALKLNPAFEPALMYLGNIAADEGRTDEATGFYKKVLSFNRKYEEAYEALKRINK